MSDRSRPEGWQNATWNNDAKRQGAHDPAAREGMAPLPGGDRRPAGDSALNRFLGGSPLSVFLRLLIVSLVVGVLLMWLDIRPMDIYYGLQRFAHRIWMLGFDSIREIGTYILAGAVIVVPVWFVLRLMNARGR